VVTHRRLTESCVKKRLTIFSGQPNLYTRTYIYMATQCPTKPVPIYPRIRYGDACYVCLVSTSVQSGQVPSGTTAANYVVAEAFNPAYPNVAHGNFFVTMAPLAQAVEHIIQPPYKPGTTEAAALIGKDIPVGANFLLQTTRDVTVDTDHTRVFLGGGYWHDYYYKAFNSGGNNEFWQFQITSPNQPKDGLYWGQSYRLYNTSYNQFAWVDWAASPIQLSSSSDSVNTADLFMLMPSQWIYYFCSAPGASGGGGCSVYCGLQLVTQRNVFCDNVRGCSAPSNVTGSLEPIYGAQADCQSACGVQRWACVNGTCQITTDPNVAGDYTTQQQCEVRTQKCQTTKYSCSSQQTCQQDIQGSATKDQCLSSCKKTYACNPSTCTCFWDPTAHETDKDRCTTLCKQTAACKQQPPPKPPKPPGPSPTVARGIAILILAALVGTIVYVAFFRKKPATAVQLTTTQPAGVGGVPAQNVSELERVFGAV